MKANEAPEKIYIVNDDLNIKREWYKTKQVGFDTTEYTRTDAFIENACDAYCAICDTKECDGCAECTWVIKFRRQLLKY